MYEYRISGIRRVIDGDTVDLFLDLGFHLNTAVRVRLLGVDTPEIRGRMATTRGREAKDFVEAWLVAAEQLTAKTVKTDHFGRWLAEIRNEKGESLADALTAAGFAKGVGDAEDAS